MYQRSGNCISDDKDTIIAIMMIMMPFDQKQKTDTSKFFCDQQPSFLHVKKPVFLFADIGTQLWWSLHLFSLSLHSKVQHFNRRPFPIISFFSQSSAHDCKSWNQNYYLSRPAVAEVFSKRHIFWENNTKFYVVTHFCWKSTNVAMCVFGVILLPHKMDFFWANIKSAWNKVLCKYIFL